MEFVNGGDLCSLLKVRKQLKFNKNLESLPEDVVRIYVTVINEVLGSRNYFSIGVFTQ